MVYSDDNDETVYGYTDDNDNDSSPEPDEDDIWLIVENTGEKYNLHDGVHMRIGRGEYQDVVISDPAKRISREHLILVRRDKEILVEVKGRNGIVIDHLSYNKGSQTSFYPPSKIEMGKIVLGLDTDMTVVHPYTPDSTASGGRVPAPGVNREYHHQTDYNAPPASPGAGEAPYASDARQDYRPSEANSFEDYNKRENQSVPPEPAYEDPRLFQPHRENGYEPVMQNKQPDYQESSNALFQGSSRGGMTPSGNIFDPSPAGGREQYATASSGRKSNLLTWGISALFIMLAAVLLLYSMWESDNSGRINIPENNPVKEEKTEVRQPASGKPAINEIHDNLREASFDKIQFETAQKHYKAQEWEDAEYYLDTISEESPYFQKANDLKARIKQEKEAQ